jgi:DNA-binding MarR family transcriptional regulator
MNIGKGDDSILVLSDYRLWTLLDSAAFAISRSRGLELAEFGLTIEQSATLNILMSRGGWTTAKELEEVTLRQHHSISILIKRMMRMGLVGRASMPGTKEYKIFITEEGQRLHRKTTTASIESIFGSLTPIEKRNLATCLQPLHEKARNLLGMPYKRYIVHGASEKMIMPDNDRSGLLSDYGLWRLLERTRFAIARLRELELAQFGLTIEQASILKILQGNGGSTTAKSLESETMRQHHSISTLVNRMIRMGLLAKERHQAGRTHTIVITEKGESLLTGMTFSALELTFSSLNTKEKRLLTSCLSSLRLEARSLLAATDAVRVSD